MADQIFNPKTLTEELLAANLPVAGVSSSGRVDYTRALTIQEKITAAAVIDAHDPSPSDAQVEKDLFASKGITDHDILMVLWKKVAYGDGTGVVGLVEKVEGE